jgi:hypothetical protein
MLISNIFQNFLYILSIIFLIFYVINNKSDFIDYQLKLCIKRVDPGENTQIEDIRIVR